MKRIFILLLAVICVTVSAQTPVAAKIKTLSVAKPGQIVSFNAAKADTLKSADTLFYKILINHEGNVTAYISQLTKLVANDTTATVTYWQSVDGSTNWQAVKKGAAQAAYSATIAKSTTTGVDVSFLRDTAYFESQYLGVRYIGKTKSGFKTILYGSIRFNNK
jgi:heme-degrading monooxygenase HmoA